MDGCRRLFALKRSWKVNIAAEMPGPDQGLIAQAHNLLPAVTLLKQTNKQTNSVDLSPRANYTD
jgi:hypothetical protein